MAAEETSLPTLDITRFRASDSTPEERREIARSWDKAMSQMGLVILTGHGLDLEAVDALDASARQFFGLTSEEKMRSCLNRGYGHGGYVPMGVEAVARSTGTNKSPPDLVENIVFNHAGDVDFEPVMPTKPKQLQPDVARYWNGMAALLGTLMRMSAIALDLPEAYFSDMFAHPKCNLRLAHYPKPSTRLPAVGQRYGEHTDYTGFTILRQDPAVGGLEAQTASGDWISVPTHPTALIVNAGDLIQVWTNDRWRSPPHRVLRPEFGDDEHPDRLSLVFFTGPSDDTLVEALPGCWDVSNPKRHAPVTAREHLMGKLSASNT